MQPLKGPTQKFPYDASRLRLKETRAPHRRRRLLTRLTSANFTNAMLTSVHGDTVHVRQRAAQELACEKVLGESGSVILPERTFRTSFRPSLTRMVPLHPDGSAGSSTCTPDFRRARRRLRARATCCRQRAHTTWYPEVTCQQRSFRGRCSLRALEDEEREFAAI